MMRLVLLRRFNVVSHDGSYRKRAGQSGQVMIMFTLMLVPLFGMMGLVIDVGWMHFVKMSAQTAAQAAAEAAITDFHATVGGAITSCGVNGVVCSSTPTTCPQNITTPANSLEHGCMYAQAHGFNSTNQWVTYQAGVNGTPGTAPGSGTASYWITFRAIQKVPQMFSAILGNMSGMVAARSTTAVMGASDCIYVLNPTAAGAISVGGAAGITSSCGIFVNSSSSNAISTWGGGSVSAPEYDLVGNTSSSLTPAPNTGVTPIGDPLAALPVPATGPYVCDSAHTNYTNGHNNDTIYPGTYCGGINVDKGTVTMSPGTYVLVGGGLSANNSNSILIGTGVTIYNTYNSVTSPYNGAFAGTNLAANSFVTLSAPNSGTYAGILFFDDRTAPASSENFGGGSTAVYQGTIYAKNAAISMGGNSSVGCKYTMVVADTFSLVGTPSFNNDYSMLPNGSPIQRVVVVE